MSRARELIEGEIRRNIPGAVVITEDEPPGISVTVTAQKFAGMVRGDREAVVYAAMGRCPLTLLAKVVSIKCRT